MVRAPITIVGVQVWLVNHEFNSEIITTVHSSPVKARLKVRDIARKNLYKIDLTNTLRARSKDGIVVYTTIEKVE